MKPPITTTETPSILDFLQQLEDLPIFNKYRKVDSNELEVPSSPDLEINVPLVGGHIGRVVEQIPPRITEDHTDALVEFQGSNQDANPDSIEEQDDFFKADPASQSTPNPATIPSSPDKLMLREIEPTSVLPIILQEKMEETSTIGKITKPTKVFEKLKDDLKLKFLLMKTKNKASTENKIRSLLEESAVNLPVSTSTVPTTLETKSPLSKFKDLLGVKVMLKNEKKHDDDEDDCARRCNECRKSKVFFKESLQKEDSGANKAVEILSGNSLTLDDFDQDQDQDVHPRPLAKLAPKTRSSRGTGDTNTYPTPAPLVPPAPLIPQAPALNNLLPALRRPQFLERLDSESSVERAERMNDGLQRLMHFVTIMAQIDSFITSRARSTIKKLAHLYGQDDKPMGYNLRSKNPDSFT